MQRYIGWFFAFVFLALAVSSTVNATSEPARTDSGTSPQAAPTLPPGVTNTRVPFQSGDLPLVCYLYKPDGNGPFPGIIWNHGSEKSPGTGPEFDAVAAIFVPAGYVVFAPIRRGHGASQGQYIQDQITQEKAAHGADAAQQLFVQLMEGPQLDHQL